MSLGITRKPDESWLDCALRYAKPWGLEGEIRDAYDAAIERGESEADAALGACMEWDVAALMSNRKEQRVQVTRDEEHAVKRPEKFWIVWNPSAPRPPTVRHSDPNLAQQEAERLALQHAPGEFFVCEAVSVSRKREVETVTLKDPDGLEIPF